MIEATTRCDGCGRELTLCVCDDRQGPFMEAILSGLGSFVVRILLTLLGVVAGLLAAKSCLPG